jgi:hypothetical protein
MSSGNGQEEACTFNCTSTGEGAKLFTQVQPSSNGGGGVSWRQLAVILTVAGLLTGGTFSLARALGSIEGALHALDYRLTRIEQQLER